MRRQHSKLNPPAVEIGVGANEEGVRPLVPKTCEDRLDLTARAGVENLDLQPHGTSGRWHVSQRGLGTCRIDRID